MLGRILRSIGALFFGHVIARLGSLVLIPLFLSRWTAPVYGEYLALFAVVSYLGGLDIGVQLAAVNRLTSAYARQDWKEYQACQHSALALYTVIAVCGTALLIPTALFLHLPAWIGLKYTSEKTAAIVIILLGTYILWSLPFRLVVAVYQSTGNLARSQWINNCQQITQVALSGVILVLGGGMVIMAAMQLLTMTVIAVLVFVDIYRRYPHLFPGFRGAHAAVLRDLLHPSILFAALMIGNVIAFQGNTLLVSAALGGLAVAVFSVSRTLVNVVREGLYTLNASLWPDLARLEAQAQWGTLRKVHRLSVYTASSLAIAAGAIVWFEGASIISTWTRGHLTPDPLLVRWFAVYLVLQTGWVASSTFTTATNRHRTYATGYLAATVISIAVSALFIRRVGVWIVPVGLIAGEAIGCYHFVIHATCKLIEEDYAAFALRFWSGLVALAAVVAAVAWAAHLVPVPNVLRWAVVIAASCGTAMLALWFGWFAANDRQSLLVRIRPRLPWASSETSAVGVGN